MKPEAIAQIEAALAAVPAAVHKKWLKLDKLPYIHATDDPNANPYSSPVVGRFDYMETADYILSCNPTAIREVLVHIAAQDAEIARLCEALTEYANEHNWQIDEQHILRVWIEPNSTTPSAYNGFELARATLTQIGGEQTALVWGR